MLGDERSQLTLAELSFDHVLWCNRYFGPRMRAVKVSSQAHLPLADASMTLCVALSVFTHIDDFESTWLAEINRVLKPGGYAYITIQSEHTWQVLDRQPWLLTSMRDDPRFPASYASEQMAPGERRVFNFMPGTRHHCCQTFVHTDYVRQCWGKWLDVVSIKPLDHHGFQTVVVLSKSEPAR